MAMRVWLNASGRVITAEGAEDMRKAILCDHCPCDDDDDDDPDPPEPPIQQEPVLTITVSGCDYKRTDNSPTIHLFHVAVPNTPITRFHFSYGSISDLGVSVTDLRNGTFAIEIKNLGSSLAYDTYDFTLYVYLPIGTVYDTSQIHVVSHTYSGSATESEYSLSVGVDHEEFE